MQVFKPKIKSLAAPQQKLWKEIGSTPRDFVLYGGTALALQLGHRQSEDFDFFSTKPFSTAELLHGVPYLRDAVILQEETDTLTCAVDRNGEIKVSFFGRLKLKKMEEPLLAEGASIRVASLLDIAGTKTALIQGRPFFRDYFDLYTLLEAGISLAEALGAAQVIYGKSFDPRVSLKALAFFEDGDLQRLPVHMQNRLAAEARKIDVGNLPQMKAYPAEMEP